MLNYEAPLTQEEYVDAVVHLISTAEGHDQRVTDHDDGEATIGYGYTFGRPDNVALWEAAGITLSTTELAVLQQIDAADTKDEKNSIAFEQFARSITLPEAQALLQQTYPEYEGPANTLLMPASYERAAFVSVTYNRGVPVVERRMGEFYAAVRAQDRAEAWYQIRYGSNALGLATINGTATPRQQTQIDQNQDSGIAKRRYWEAEVFGLYEPAVSVTPEEAKQIYRMLTRHRREIETYERRYGVAFDGTLGTRLVSGLPPLLAANRDYSLTGVAAVESIHQELSAARDTLLAEQRSLNATLHSLDLSDAAGYLPVNIYLDPGRDNPSEQVTANHSATLIATELNADGTERPVNNILVGEGGNDYLLGGQGDDILLGGTGDDMYSFRSGDGQDVIVDQGGEGELFLDGERLALGLRNGADEWGQGAVTYTRSGSDLEIALAGRTDTITIKDFDFALASIGYLGVRLVDRAIVIRPGRGANPFDDPSFDPASAPSSVGTLREGGVATYTLYLPYEADSGGQRVRLTLSGGAVDKLAVLRYADELALGADGAFELVIPEGQREVSFGLLAKEDIDADETLVLTTDLVDASGAQMVVAYEDEEEVQLDAEAETIPATTREIRGDWAPKPYIDPETGLPYVDPVTGEISYYYDDLGNYERLPGVLNSAEWDQQPGPLWGSSGPDHIVVGDFERGDAFGFGGDDFMVGSELHGVLLWGGEGNDRIEGGEDTTHAYDYSWTSHPYLDIEIFLGESKLYGGAGDDEIWGESEARQAELIDPAQIATNMPGEWITGGSGNDNIYGSNGDDLLFGGRGDDRLTGGVGMDVLLGDDDFLNSLEGAFWRVLHTNFGNTTYSGFELGIFPVLADPGMWELNEVSSLTGDPIFSYYKNSGGADLLIGGAGKDILIGQLGDDALYGGEDDDILAGWEGADDLYGGEGNDLIAGDFGRYERPWQRNPVSQELAVPGVLGSPVSDGSTVDQIGSDFLDGGAGNDTMYGEGGSDWVLGGDGDDTLYGDAGYLPAGLHGDDVLEGGGGNDTLHGNAGADRLYGGAGDDSVHGDAGDDMLDGGTGTDQLYGGDGSDRLMGGDGDDRLYGGEAEDILYGEAGADRMGGGAGDDALYGGAGEDILLGGAGDDTIMGGPGIDVLRGGPGDDVYVIELGYGRDIVDDSEGRNRILFASGIAPDDLSADLDDASLVASLSYGFTGDGLAIDMDAFELGAIEFANGAVWGGKELANVVPALNVLGSALGEALVGNPRLRNELRGLGGDDIVTGSANNDTLDGGDGADALDGGGGSDRYLVSGTETGIDRISDSGIAARAYLSWYYGNLGIVDAELRVERGGKYGAGGQYFDTYAEAYDYISGEGEIVFVEPLPEGAPLVTRNDSATLDALTAAGVLDADVVELGPEITLNDLELTVTVLQAMADEHPEQPWYGGGVLSVRWAGGGFDIDVPDVNYGFVGLNLIADGIDNPYYVPAPGEWKGYRLGEGIEAFEFADGSRYTLEEILQFAAVVTRDGVYDLLRGSDYNAIDPGAQSIAFEAGVAPSDVIVQRGETDLQFWLTDFSAWGNIENWYVGTSNTVEFRFADGTVWDAESIDANATYVEPDTTFWGSGDDETIIGADGADSIYGQAGNDVLDGLRGDDQLEGGEGDDVLYGREGTDYLDGGEGADVLVAGPGGQDWNSYDYLVGGPGDDTYRFALGDGFDIISDWDETEGNIDTVEFAPGILPSDVKVTQDSWGYALVLPGGADSIYLEGMVDSPSVGVERVAFSDGTVWTPDDLAARVELLPATPFADTLWGTAGPDSLDGLAGADWMFGNEGDDVLNGGTGDDYIEGGSGSDILRGGAGVDDLEEWDVGNNLMDAGAGDDYVYEEGYSFVIGGAGDDWIENFGDGSVIAFNPDDGHDTVYAVGALTLSIGGGIQASDLSLTQDGDDFALSVGASDSVRLTRQWEDDPQAWPAIVLQLFGSVHAYDFNAVIDEFHTQASGTPGFVLSLDGVLQAHEFWTSTTEAFGGAIAWEYATAGGMAGLSDAQLQAILADENFGVVPQPIAIEAGNQSPGLADPIADQQASEDAAYIFALPAGTFSDPDAGDALTYTASLADGSALPGWLAFDATTQTFSGTPANEDVGTLSLRVTASDAAGAQASDVFDLTVVNTNDAPVVAAVSGQTLLLDQTVDAGALFTVSDADGDSPAAYKFYDGTAGGGHFTVNGVEQAAGSWFSVSAADLANTQFVASDAIATDGLYAQVSDGMSWSAQRYFTVNSWPHATNSAPTVSATSGQTLLLEQVVDASALFTVSDAEGDALASYKFYDGTAGGGHFTVNGVEQASGSWFSVSAADLANTQFVASGSIATDGLYVQVSDGMAWSAQRYFTVNSWSHATNSAPTVSAASGQTLLLEQAVDASALFTVADAEGDTPAAYQFYDGTAGGGHFTVNGAEQAAGSWFSVAAADLANTRFVASDSIATDGLYVQVSDGMAWSAQRYFTVNSWPHAANSAPTVTATSGQTLLLNQAVDAGALFAVSDAEADTPAAYQFYDGTAGGGHFTVNGIEQAAGSWFSVSAADLANTQFVGSDSVATDGLYVQVSDGMSWSAQRYFTVNSWPHATNTAPTVTATTGQTVLLDQAVDASALFTVNDVDGDTPAAYQFYDGTVGGGHFTVNGAEQAAGSWFSVAAADLANTRFVGSDSIATDGLYVQASDGMSWSAQRYFTVNSWPHATNSAPTVSATSGQTILLDQTVDAGALFTLSDADGDNPIAYKFYDGTAGGGHFTVNGAEQAAGSWFSVAAADLANTRFVGSDSIATDGLYVQASDGMSWSAQRYFTVNSWPHATNSAPTVTATSGQTVLLNQAVDASALFTVTDAEGDTPAAYKFYDGTVGGGHFTVNGVEQVAGSWFSVAAADLANTQFVGSSAIATDGLYAQVSDGMTWSAQRYFTVNSSDAMLAGTSAADTLAGDADTLILQGQAGDDTLSAGDAGSLLSGGEGADNLAGGAGSDFLSGGTGNDTVYTGAGANVIGYNAGDGFDTVYSGVGAANTLSFGGGIGYDDLSLTKDGDDLVVNTGAGEGLVLKDWYAGNDTVLSLQILLDATDEFDAASADPLLNRRVQTFDFAGLVNRFDQALVESPGLTSWQVTNALLQFHLAGADDAALGGDLAYWYGKNGALAGMSLAAAQQAIGAPGFGAEAQTLHPFSGLQEGLVKLS